MFALATSRLGASPWRRTVLAYRRVASYHPRVGGHHANHLPTRPFFSPAHCKTCMATCFFCSHFHLPIAERSGPTPSALAYDLADPLLAIHTFLSGAAGNKAAAANLIKQRHQLLRKRHNGNIAPVPATNRAYPVALLGRHDRSFDNLITCIGAPLCNPGAGLA